MTISKENPTNNDDSAAASSAEAADANSSNSLPTNQVKDPKEVLKEAFRSIMSLVGSETNETNKEIKQHLLKYGYNDERIALLVNQFAIKIARSLDLPDDLDFQIMSEPQDHLQGKLITHLKGSLIFNRLFS